MFLFCSTALASLCVSVGSFMLVERLLEGRIAILGSWLGLQLAYNTGIAFSIQFPPLVQIFAIALAMLLVIWMAVKVAHTPLEQVGFGLIVGGGIANIIDRLLDGKVTDMIQIGHFPIFNTADSFITIGAVLLLWETRHQWVQSKQKQGEN